MKHSGLQGVCRLYWHKNQKPKDHLSKTMMALRNQSDAGKCVAQYAHMGQHIKSLRQQRAAGSESGACMRCCLVRSPWTCDGYL